MCALNMSANIGGHCACVRTHMTFCEGIGGLHGMPSDMSIPCVRVLEKFAAYLAICTRFVVPTDVISQALIGAHMFTANVTSVDDNFPGMCGGHVFIQQTLFGKSFTTAFGSFAHELSCVFQFMTFK